MTSFPTKLLLFVISMFLFFACRKDDIIPTKMMQENPGSVSDTIGRGVFTSFAHSLQGKVVLYNDATGNKKLRLQEFTMTPGPEVYVYLSTKEYYDPSSVVQIARLMNGFSNSDFVVSGNYSGYTSEHKYVLVYCVQYTTLFGFAELK